jgi:hypothetical protein
LWLFTGILWGFNYRNFTAASEEVADESGEIYYQDAA